MTFIDFQKLQFYDLLLVTKAVKIFKVGFLVILNQVETSLSREIKLKKLFVILAYLIIYKPPLTIKYEKSMNVIQPANLTIEKTNVESSCSK